MRKSLQRRSCGGRGAEAASLGETLALTLSRPSPFYRDTRLRKHHFIGAAAWALAAFGALKVADYPGDFAHVFCGAWG